MPLSFDSASHGPVAFGFFNIESDMLLLEHYFFFANIFCESVSRAALKKNSDFHGETWEVYDIPDPRAAGDLRGAIHGVVFTGFIGELYRRFPFPGDPDGFKQKPEGYRTRAQVEEIIEKYSRTVTIDFRVDDLQKEARIGEYRFDVETFHRLIQYVWVGGYPRWEGEERPGYVQAMKEAVASGNNPVFSGIDFQI